MEYTASFDLDLKYGQIGEKTLSEILSGTKVEVKTERGIWMHTGNIAIEYKSRGKFSGIAITKAEWWVTILMNGENIEHIIFTPTQRLRKLVMQGLRAGRSVKGGDSNTSDLVLIKISDLFRGV